MIEFKLAGKHYKVVSELQNLEESKAACDSINSEIARLDKVETEKIKVILDSFFVENIKFIDISDGCHSVFTNINFQTQVKNFCKDLKRTSQTLCRSSFVEETTVSYQQTTASLAEENPESPVVNLYVVIGVFVVLFLLIGLCFYLKFCKNGTRIEPEEVVLFLLL